jgi:hypothetical protein
MGSNGAADNRFQTKLKKREVGSRVVQHCIR